jgi:predicted DNA-binding protein with PD1-like motif
MQHSEGKLGRVFLLRFGHQEDLRAELEAFSRRKRVATAVVLFLGALESGKLVTGPKRARVPPEPNWMPYTDGWETLGIGTIFPSDVGPQLHLHGALGKGRRTLTGCVRKEPKVFLVMEAVLLELKGVRADKPLDPATGLRLLRLRA